MGVKEPVLLLVLVDPDQLRWFTAGIGPDREMIPLLCSEVGDLAPYQNRDLEEQLFFLRHRFCGILQQGCDRLWERGKKAGQFAFVFEGELPEPSGQLTRAIADHLALWMVNPPVAVFTTSSGSLSGERPQLTLLSGQLGSSWEDLLFGGLPLIQHASKNPAFWELAKKKINDSTGQKRT
jgi:hypothetical protein